MSRTVKIVSTLAIVANLLLATGLGIAFLLRDREQEPQNASTSAETAATETDDFDTFQSYRMGLPETSGEASVVAVGDIMLSRTVEKKQLDNGWDYPFEKVAAFLRSGDITFGNLETSITPGALVVSGQMLFRAAPESADALAAAGFSIVSLANNHAMNFGQKGILNTFEYLKNAGVQYSGGGKNTDEAYAPIYLEANGTRFAFLSYTDADIWGCTEATGDSAGLAVMDHTRMAEGVKAAKAQADYVILSMHSGTEYVRDPRPNQVNFAHAAVDAGADLVIGHHPHWVEGWELYNGKYIFWSLGNFVFDQMWSRETMEGLGVRLVFENGLERFELLPVVIEDYAQPRPVTGDEAADIFSDASLEPAARKIYTWDGSAYQATDLPTVFTGQTQPETRLVKSFSADTDGNGTQETFFLKDGAVVIKEGDRTIWESEKKWWVDDVQLADADGDGKQEVTMSVWKSGDFGSSKPFWVKENDMSIKNHFFVYRVENGELKQVWMSSNLDAPNCAYAFGDVNGDEKQELVVIEGDYADYPACHGSYAAVWSWNQFGFENDWRSDVGSFSSLEVVDGTFRVDKQ